VIYMKEIILRNGILKSTKDIEVFKYMF